MTSEDKTRKKDQYRQSIVSVLFLCDNNLVMMIQSKVRIPVILHFAEFSHLTPKRMTVWWVWNERSRDQLQLRSQVSSCLYRRDLANRVMSGKQEYKEYQDLLASCSCISLASEWVPRSLYHPIATWKWLCFEYTLLCHQRKTNSYF